MTSLTTTDYLELLGKRLFWIWNDLKVQRFFSNNLRLIIFVRSFLSSRKMAHRSVMLLVIPQLHHKNLWFHQSILYYLSNSSLKALDSYITIYTIISISCNGVLRLEKHLKLFIMYLRIHVRKSKLWYFCYSKYNFGYWNFSEFWKEDIFG